MKKRMTIIAASLVLGACLMQTGCKSTTAPVKGTGDAAAQTVADSATELGKAYYNQPNMAEVIHIEGTNLTFNVSGASKFIFNMPVPAKQIMPRENSWYEGLFDTAKTYAPWLFMAYWVNNGGFGNTKTTSTTTNNY